MRSSAVEIYPLFLDWPWLCDVVANITELKSCKEALHHQNG